MKIVRQNADGLVLRAAPEMRLEADGVYGDGWRDRTIDPTSVEIVSVSALPDKFLAGHFTYANGVFAVVDQAALDVAWDKREARKPVPQIVSMRQARLALLGAGLLDQVDAAIDGMSEPERSAARIEWEYATEVRRNSDLVLSLSAALNLSSADVDALFKQAATL